MFLAFTGGNDMQTVFGSFVSSARHSKKGAPTIGGGSVAIGMHRAMNHDRWNLRSSVRVDDPLHERPILDGAETFVVNHEVVTVDPITLLLNVRFDAALTSVLQDRPLNVADALRQAFGEALFLILIIVAATAGNQQRADL